jgi:hypothetical protein
VESGHNHHFIELKQKPLIHRIIQKDTLIWNLLFLLSGEQANINFVVFGYI